MDNREPGKPLPPFPKKGGIKKHYEIIDACNECYKLALLKVAEPLQHASPLPGLQANKFPPGWKPVKSQFVNKCGANNTNTRNIRHYATIEKDENGRTYEVIIDKRNDVNTVIIHGNEQDRKAGLVGTNNCAVVKLFGPKSYDYIKVDDYVVRLRGFINAAKDKFKDNIALVKELDKIAAEAYMKIMTESDFHDDAHSIRTDKGKNTYQTTHHDPEPFKALHKRTKKLLNETLQNCGKLIAKNLNPDVEADDTAIANAVNVIKLHEVQVVCERGRPLDIKISEVAPPDDNSGAKPVKLLSAEMPRGEKTLTSAYRLGEDSSTKVSNHNDDISAVYIPISDKFVQQLSIGGHSSYDPIQQKDVHQRRYISYLGLLEVVTQKAEDAVRKKPWSDTIEINLNAMMLLTPFNKKVDKLIRHKASEYDQLENNRFAYEMLRNQQPLVIRIDGKDVTVKLTINYMNTPVNVSGALMQTTDPELDKEINARGFFEFKQKMGKQVEEGLVKKLDLLTNQVNGDNKRKIEDLIIDLQAYHHALPGKETMEYVKAVSSISPENPDIQKLNQLYDSLRLKLQFYYEVANASPENYSEGLKSLIQKHAKSYYVLQSDSPEARLTLLNILGGDIDDIQSDIQKIKKPMRLLNTEPGIDARYLEIDRMLQNQHQNDDRLTTNLAMQASIDSILRDKTIKLPNDIKQSLIAQLRYLRAEDAYHNRFNRAEDMAYELPVNYLLANYSIGELIEAFCKSGEDRTGALRVILLANIAFQAMYGHAPNLSDPQENSNYHAMLTTVLEISAALECTMHCSDARSLQINGKNITDFNIKSGKEISVLHKKIYEEFEMDIIDDVKSAIVTFVKKVGGSGSSSRISSSDAQSPPRNREIHSTDDLLKEFIESEADMPQRTAKQEASPTPPTPRIGANKTGMTSASPATAPLLQRQHTGKTGRTTPPTIAAHPPILPTDTKIEPPARPRRDATKGDYPTGYNPRTKKY